MASADPMVDQFNSQVQLAIQWLQSGTTGGYYTNDGSFVPSPAKLMFDLNAAINLAAGGILAQSQAAATVSQQWATKTDGPVSGSDYSAKFHAQAAAASDSSAAGHEAGAAAQAGIATSAASNSQSKSRVAALWSTAVGWTPTVIGEAIEVLLSDTGSHTDPVSGLTVLNTGTFSANSLATGDWKRIGDVQSAGKVDVSTLSSTYTQTVGRSVAPIDGATASNAAYIFADPVAHAGYLASMRLWAEGTGTISVARYTQSGTTLTRVGGPYTGTVSATGDQTVSFSTAIPVQPGEYIGVYGNGIVSYTVATADGAGFWTVGASLPSSATVGSPGTFNRLQIGLSLTYLQQSVTAASVAALSTAVAVNTGAIATQKVATDQLLGTVVSVIGRPVDPVAGTTASNFAFVMADAVPQSGYLSDLTINPKATGTLAVGRYTRSGTTGTRVATYSVPITALGLQTINLGTSIPVVAGEFLAIAGAGILSYTNTAADGAGYWSLSASMPSTGTLNVPSTNPRLEFALRVSYTAQTVTAPAQAAIAARVSALEAGSAASPLNGKKVGVIGDSLSSLYSQLWQNAFCARTGATLWKQDARPGRTFFSALEGYGASAPLASIASLAGYSGSTALTGAIGTSGTLATYNIYGQAHVDGESLATWLADLDFLVIWLGTNDANLVQQGTRTVGAVGDAYTSNTILGAMSFLLDALLSAKPGLRIMVVGPYQTTSYYSYANLTAVVTGMKALLQSYSIPFLDMLSASGINAKNVGTMLRDGIHATDTTFTQRMGPLIGAFAMQCADKT